MTQFRRLARHPALAGVAALVFACSAMSWPSVGETKKPKPAPQQPSQPAQNSQASQASQDDAAQKQQQTAAARQAYDAGLKAFANGKYQPAIDLLSTALKGGGLASTEMAKALYTRGVAYKKQSKPGLAISDLTSALWLKNGLNGSDRTAATAERSEAYKMAGLADTGSSPDKVVVTDPNLGPNSSSAGLSAAAVAEAAAPGSRPVTANAAGAGSDTPTTITHQDASSEAAQDAARARAAYAPVDDGGLQAAASSPVVASAGPAAASPAASPFALAPAAEAAPSATPSPTASTPSLLPSGVTGFFSNMFGGGTPAATVPAQPPATVTTASTSAVEPETSSWSNSTVVTDGSTTKKAGKKHVQVAAVTPAAAAPVARQGKYKVHIAALRSRAEAETLAAQLVAQHGADLANHAPTVDEAVIGSMGTFYRVRVGGYASQDEPRGLCNKLRTSGLDCLVVTN